MSIGFVAVPGFNMMSLSAAIEPLRIANRLRNRELFRWRTLWCDGQRTTASNGLAIEPDDTLTAVDDLDVLFVCASFGAFDARGTGVEVCLKRAKKAHVSIGGIGTGTYYLAWAGLLAGHRCTIHWEHIPALREAYPLLDITENLYEVDRSRFTTGGGTAVLDMLLHLIAQWIDPRLAVEISGQVLYRNIRPADDHQLMAEDLAAAHSSPSLSSAVALMRANIEDPFSIPQIAASVGLSQRQLERLFQTHFGESPLDHYTGLRLDQARNLLRETSLKVHEVAVAVGFAGTGHFSRQFTRRFGHRPSLERVHSHRR